MPIYEYVCQKCGNEFEQMQKISEPPTKKCPSCGGGVEKKLSLSSFQLKGSGWYATDYAKKDKEKKEKKEEKKEKKEKKEESTSPSKGPSGSKSEKACAA